MQFFSAFTYQVRKITKLSTAVFLLCFFLDIFSCGHVAKEHAEQYNLIDAVCQQLSEECAFDTSTKGKIKLVSMVRKRKVKDTNMDAMPPPGTLQLKTERDFVAQTSSNIKQLLEELELKIFDLQLLLIDGNVAVGTPKYLLLNK
jgi:hypothetical protein